MMNYYRSRKRTRSSSVMGRKKRKVASTPASRILIRSGYPGYVAYGGNTAPDRAVVKMDYSQFNRLNSGSVTFATQIFRGNSIFDPDLSGVGHQPLSSDQWANLYEYYRVVASWIEVRAVNNSTNPAILVLLPSEEGATIDSGNPDTYVEAANSKYIYLGGSSGNNTGKLIGYMTTARALGIRKTDSGFDEAAPFGSNPSTAAGWFWHINAAVRSGLPDVEIHTRIIYTVELLKRKQLAQS